MSQALDLQAVELAAEQNWFAHFRSESIELIRKLNEGGRGVVFEGLDKSLGRPVAVKILAAHLHRSAAARERLLREAQAAAQLQHENVVAIHSVHLSDDQPYIVQQLVRGESLREIRASGISVPRRATRFGGAIDQGTLCRSSCRTNSSRFEAREYSYRSRVRFCYRVFSKHQTLL